MRCSTYFEVHDTRVAHRREDAALVERVRDLPLLHAPNLHLLHGERLAVHPPHDFVHGAECTAAERFHYLVVFHTGWPARRHVDASQMAASETIRPAIARTAFLHQQLSGWQSFFVGNVKMWRRKKIGFFLLGILGGIGPKTTKVE